MIQVQYQLRFEDFAEAMSAVRGRALKRARASSRGKRALIIAGTLIGVYTVVDFVPCAGRMVNLPRWRFVLPENWKLEASARVTA